VFVGVKQSIGEFDTPATTVTVTNAKIPRNIALRLEL